MRLDVIGCIAEQQGVGATGHVLAIQCHVRTKRGGLRQHREHLTCAACAGRQMFAEVVQPLLCHFIQGFNTTVRP